jgi:hypothetical protein
VPDDLAQHLPPDGRMGDGVERAPVVGRAKDATAELGAVDAVRVQ